MRWFKRTHIIVSVSVVQESRYDLAGCPASESYKAAIKVSAGAAVLHEAQVGNDLLLSLRGCWQHSIPGMLLN